MIETDILQTVAIVLAIIFFIVSHYFDRKVNAAKAFKTLGVVYDEIVKYRLQYPDVVLIGEKWKNGDLEKINTDGELTTYYSYGELCISFCNNYLYHKNNRIISNKDLNDYYSGLMNLLAIENENFFKDIILMPYCSTHFYNWFTEWQQQKRR